jgi:hypothetical protein
LRPQQFGAGQLEIFEIFRMVQKPHRVALGVADAKLDGRLIAGLHGKDRIVKINKASKSVENRE